MTTPQLLQQAKQGDPDAIAHLMNQSLEAKGIKATVSRQSDRLQVLLNSENELNQTLLTQFIHKGIQNLSIPDVTAVEVTGQSKETTAWSQTLVLQPSAGPFSAPSSSQLPPPPSQSIPPSSPPVPPSPQPPIPPPQPTETVPSDMTAASLSSMASDNFEDDLDLSAAALSDDFSLDDELSMAEIDQIVADAVKEVTTKIQSEIPFDPATDTGSDADLYGLPDDDTDSIPNLEGPTDEAIRQAMQTNDLDAFIDQALASPDAVTTIEQDNVDDLPSIDTADFQPLRNVEVETLDDDGSVQADPEVTADTPIADRVDMNSDGNDEGGASASTDTTEESEKPASKVLLTLVSFITFGSIAALIGYSVQAYASNGGDFLSFPPSLSVQEDDASSSTEGTAADAAGQDAGDTASVDDTSTNADGESGDGDEAIASSDDADGTDAADTTDAQDDDAEAEASGEGASDDNANDESSDADTAAEGDDQSSDATTSGSDSDGAAIASIACIDISGESGVTVAQIALNPDVAVKNETYPVMGCLTNHTDTPIISAVLKYQGQPVEAAADIVPVDEWALSSTNEGISKLTFEAVPPNTTVPFIADIPVAEGTTSLDINSLAWRPEGWSGEAKSLTLNVSMPLTDAN